MNIPERIKIGGKTYSVKETDLLPLGRDYTGEIDYENQVIYIRPANSERMEATLLHEMLHAIFDHLGYTEHNEKHIDELANALHMVITDNPKLFSEEEKRNDE